MLDLNLDTFSGAGSHRDTDDITAPAKAKNLKEDSRTATDEDSGTSCSSVIIAGEETTSTAAGGFISFDILKGKGKETPQKEGNNPSRPEYSTFLATGEKGFSSFASGEGKWLKLSSPLFTSEGVKFGRSNNNNNNNNNNNSHRSIRKSRRGPRSRSSPYRGVTFYRRTGRWESHIWDCGKQVYLGGFDSAHSAARAYDRAAIKFRGLDADINFEASDYEEEMKLTRNLTKEEFVQFLRRLTNAGGGSRYRGGGGGGSGGIYKSDMPLETRTSQLFAGNKICNISDNNTSRDVTTSGCQTSMRGVKTVFGPNNGEDKGQNLELSLGLSPTTSREGKFPEWVEPNGDLSSCTMTFAVKQNPVVLSRIYPHHRSINHQPGIVEKKVEEFAPYNEIPSNRSWRSIQGNNNNNIFVFNGVCAASSRFPSSSNSSSSTGPADSSSSLDLSLKPSNSSNVLGDIASLSSTNKNHWFL